jgi:hypothetical protein
LIFAASVIASATGHPSGVLKAVMKKRAKPRGAGYLVMDGDADSGDRETPGQGHRAAPPRLKRSRVGTDTT